MLTYVHNSSGIHHLISYVSHAVIWQSIRRFMYHIPLVGIGALFIVACIFIVIRKVR